MQIHELNNYSGSLDDAYLVADNGSDTGKMKTTALTDPLNERIDNIIAGPAPSASEIIDARRGVSGKNFASLGAAIRGQIGNANDNLVEFKNEISNQIWINVNAFDGYWSNAFYYASDGTYNPVLNLRYVSCDNKISVSSGDVLTFEKIPSIFISCFVLYYTDDSYISFEQVNFYDVHQNSFTIVIPDNATKIAFEFNFASDTPVDDLDTLAIYINKSQQSTKERIENNTNRIDEINNVLSDLVEIDSNKVLNYIFTLVTKAPYAYSDAFYMVVEREKIGEYIIVNATVNKNFPPVVYLNGSEPSQATYIGQDYCGVTSPSAFETVNNYKVENIPAGCTHILLQSASISSVEYSFKTLQYIDFKSLKKAIKATIHDEILRVVTPFGDKRLLIEFGKRGVNNIADFRYIYVDNSAIYSNITDWHSPLIVGAKNNIDGDHPNDFYFTGGNHAYNNTGSGVPSGRTDSLKYYVDGKEVTEFDGYCSNVRIEWVNLVQGYNTEKADGSGREIIREEHRLVFDGYEWTSDASYIPLEDVLFKTLYGFQCEGTANEFPSIRFVGGLNRGLYQGNTDCDSGNKTCNMFAAYGNLLRLEMEVDPNVDIGDRHLYTGTKGCFNNGYGKAYFNFLTDVNMAQGELYAIRGFYRFLPV